MLTSDSTLRFRGIEEIEQSLNGAGYTTTEVRDAPDRPGHEYVFIAQYAPACVELARKRHSE